MCLICIDLQKQKLSSFEARRNLGEIYTTLDNDHIIEVLKEIWRREDAEFQKKDFNEYMRTCEE
tara:strand:- start:311 stop:502 length:192 start_codon:yes stop_codon:yes gene_type:complete